MYITKQTKTKDLPEGNYILKCINYVDSKQYFLINKKLARFEVFNTAYALSNNKIGIKGLKKDALYEANIIPEDKYKLFNL